MKDFVSFLFGYCGAIVVLGALMFVVLSVGYVIREILEQAGLNINEDASFHGFTAGGMSLVFVMTLVLNVLVERSS